MKIYRGTILTLDRRNTIANTLVEDKGRGVALVAKALGADMADTVGFGDSMNDLEMIETVGTSVWMANGSPQLKKRSQIVCPSVQEDGLAKAFQDLGLVNSTKNEA